MIIISHDCNTDGPGADIAYSVQSMNKLLNLGYYVQVDISLGDDNQFYYGDGSDKSPVEVTRLMNPRMFFRCRDVRSFLLLRVIKHCRNFFFQDKDPVSVTSSDWVWVNSDQVAAFAADERQNLRRCIAFLPENSGADFQSLKRFGGICTDYPYRYKQLDNDTVTLHDE